MDDFKEPTVCGKFPVLDILRLVKKTWHNVLKERRLFIRLNILLKNHNSILLHSPKRSNLRFIRISVEGRLKTHHPRLFINYPNSPMLY